MKLAAGFGLVSTAQDMVIILIIIYLKLNLGLILGKRNHES